MKVGKQSVAQNNKINAVVTSSHILVTLAFVATQIEINFETSFTQDYRMNSAYYFFAGVADMFLTIMLWQILDTQKSPALFVDGERVYAVT